MPSRLEELVASWQGGALSLAERGELLRLVGGSSESARVAARDRLVDRWLRQSRQPALDPELILRAIAEQPSGLAARTMAELERREAKAGRVGLRAFWDWLFTGRLGLAALATAVAAVAICASIYLSQPAPARIQVGQLASMVGTPKILREGERIARLASRPTTIYAGDRIETGDADKAELQFPDGTALRLSFNTTLEVPGIEGRATRAGGWGARSATNPTGNGSEPFPRSNALTSQRFNLAASQRSNASPLQRPPELKLLAGQVWAKVQKTTNEAQFAIQTPVATASVKGTEFSLKLRQVTPPSPLAAPKPGEGGSPLVPPAASPRPPPLAPLEAVLAVKEGTVEFSNAFGRVEATNLTESVASANAAPTPPHRVSSLKAFYVKPSIAVVLSTSRPSLPEAGYRLAYRGGWAGLDVATVTTANPTQAVATAAVPQLVRVVRVQKDSPAASAGLRLGDIISSINGRTVTNAWEVYAAIFKRLGARVTLTLANEAAGRVVTLTTMVAPDAPPVPAFFRPVAMALEAASRLLIDRRYEEGERALTRLLTTEAQAAAHNDLGLLFETRDDYVQALAHYHQAVAAAPDVALYHFNYALALQNIGNLERAVQEAELATTLAPSWGEAFELLAEIRTPLERYTEALQALDTALSARPESPDLWVSKGRALAEQDRLEEAHQALSKAIELEPDFADALRELGDVCHHQQRLEEAEGLLRRAIEIDPSDARSFNVLGNVQLDQGRPTEAEQSLREAIRLDPTYVLAYSNLGYLCRRAGRAVEAEQLYRKAIELDPDSVVAHTNLGELLRRLGRLEEAEKMLRTVIELDPQNAIAINNLGGLYFYDRHQPDLADPLFRHAIQVDPGLPYPYSNLGNLLSVQGNLDEAELMYRKAIELFGERPEAARTWANLGKLEEKRGDPPAAVEAYRKALNLNPDFSEAADALKRLGP